MDQFCAAQIGLFMRNDVTITAVDFNEAPVGPLAPAADWHDMGERDHFVQFYEHDDFLVESVSGYAAAALRNGEAAVIIATKAHRDAIETCLTESGLDVAAASAEGRYFSLDAAQTLFDFMVGGVPDEARFRAVIGEVMGKAGKDQRKVCAFGEMVALLFAEGNAAAAIRLEELWNDLRRKFTFSLFCAYPMQLFRREEHAEAFQHICRGHSRVIPAESYAATEDSDARLRMIGELQQQAMSLENESAERRHAEENFRHERSRLAMAVALAQMGIWELNMVSQELTGSDLFKANLGLTAGEPLTYQRFFDLIHSEDVEQVRTTLRTAMATGTEFKTEYRVSGSDGEVRWIGTMGRCFHNGSHRLLGVTLDITERKRAAEILEKTVERRTAELQHSVAELEAFSYSISHDMRAPLRSMQGFAKILLEDCGETLSSENYNYLERIAASAQRMDRLIQDVLTFSRVARSELTLEPVNLDHLVRGIVECYPNLQTPQAEIVIEGTLPCVRGNAPTLTQCLSNLLGNAVKFVRRGTHPRVRIWAEPVGNGEFIRLSIQDNGIGVAEEFHDRIFGIFHRLSKHYDGTGIGLAIVKKGADRMGAKVGVKSKVDEGSTFWLELKAAETAAG
jgi:PAS domain S-box-containing protein